MVSSRPFLIRAIYEWINENDWTPYIVIDAEHEGVQVPKPYVQDGQIILNISSSACRGLHMANDRIVFSASFSGTSYQIFAPPEAIVAIYAKENGRGMVFSEEEEGNDGSTPDSPSSGSATIGNKPAKSSKRPKPQLKVVK